jgi:ubiquinone/menaquinone biosynthesis C-methylase UbiE
MANTDMTDATIEEATLHILNESRNYSKWIYDLIKSHLGEYILEVGCGIGNNTNFLLEKNRKVLCVDINHNHLAFIRNRFKNLDNFKAEFNDIAVNGGIIEQRFKTITCLNVLHHIENQNSALMNMYELLDDAGKLIILEPALPQIYGSLDRNENCLRRYSKDDLKNILMDNRFRVDICRYVNFIGAIGWFINGRILKRKILSKKQTRYFDKIVPFTANIEKGIPIPFGLSLLCVCEKSGDKK